jgi:hypothetical protein
MLTVAGHGPRFGLQIAWHERRRSEALLAYSKTRAKEIG